MYPLLILSFLMSTALVSAFSGMLDVGAFDAPMQVVMVSVADGYTGEAEAWYDLTCLSSFGTAFDRASSMSIATCTIIENM